MKNKFNALQKKFNELLKYCNLETDYETAFVVRIGWKYRNIIQQEAVLAILNKTNDFEDVYLLECTSSYRDPDGDTLVVVNESLFHYKPLLDEAEWYLELEEDLTSIYRGKQWYEVKKAIYEEETRYCWYDKEEFLNNYDDPEYIVENTVPLIHVFTSALKNELLEKHRIYCNR